MLLKTVKLFESKYNRIGKIPKRFLTCTEGEPKGPTVNTSMPGPRTKDLIKHLSALQYTKTVTFFGDYKRSIGNYVFDADGNAILDMYMQISTMPLGYNNPDVLKVFENPDNINTLINRPALGMFPSIDWPKKLNEVLLSISPNLPNICTMMCGSCANESAFRSLFITYMRRERGLDVDYSNEEKMTALLNKPPGCPDLTILSFEGGFHGMTLGALSTSRSKLIHKLDTPAFDWPIAPFPRYKYPLESHLRENKKEDARCIEVVEDLFHKYKKKCRPVVGIIVEPIQSDGGDNEASPDFFQKLQDITTSYRAGLIMDEVQTGCGMTGKMWCHEHFMLREPPDIVSFSKKMQVAGYYHKVDFMQKHPFSIFNTWMGDPSKLLIIEAIIKVIYRDKLLEHVVCIGQMIKEGLQNLEDEFSPLVDSVRGRGTFLAISASSFEMRENIVKELLREGVLVGRCGSRSIRLRPALICQEKHVDIFLDKFRKVLKKMYRLTK